MSDQMEAGARRIVTHRLQNGRTITLSTLGYRDYASARDECVREFKRNFIETWLLNLDLLPDEDQQAHRDQAFHEASKISYADLPKKTMGFPQRRNGKVVTNGDGNPIMDEKEVEYSIWWMSETPHGQLFMIWQSMRYDPAQADVTIDDAEAIFDDRLELEAAAQLAGEVSESRLDLSGKEQTPLQEEPAEKRDRRRRRRRRTGR